MGRLKFFFIHPIDLPCIILDDNFESGGQSQKPFDVPDHTPMPSPMTSHVPTPMALPVPASMDSPLPTPMVSPFPSPMASPLPTLVPSAMPSPDHTPVASPVTDFSNDYESVEDKAYRPSPHVSEGDEMDDSVVDHSGMKKNGLKTPTNRKKGASSNEKGEEVSVSGRRKKGKSDSGSGCGGTTNRAEIQNNEGEDISKEDEVIVGGTVGHRETYSQGMPNEPQLNW
ncbi:hypothetical protein SESBI_45938 [Sesbania bispinosa]|nr:hypothetical protein SESBI_45938 [Sesbania bispinosa]